MERETKIIRVTRPSMPSMEEFWEEISSIWETCWLTNMGPKHQKLENALREYLGVKQLSLFSNGHMALEFLLQAMDLKGEVITTPFTFVSTTHAIVRNGLTPVFCDIDRENFTMDVSVLETLITERTCAIVPVHVYGRVCQVEKIQEIADKYGLKVIYDAAHAFGVTYKGKGIGNWGDASMFSFHATKVYHTVEGGAAVFSSPELYRRLYNLKNFGIEGEEIIRSVGANAKLSEFHAAMGLCNLRHIDEEIEKRGQVDRIYRERLSDIPGIYFPPIQAEVKSNFAYFPIVIREEEFGISRDQVYEELKKQRIFTRKYFYPLTSCAECYQNIVDCRETPRALWVSSHVLALPIYAELSGTDAEQICGALCSLGAGGKGGIV